MESAGTLPRLPSFKDLRSGQQRVVDLFAKRDSVVAQLPTGYGKTLTAACSYIILRARGVANRLLIIVPSSAQARQVAEEIPRDLMRFGDIKTQAFEVGRSPIPALNANRKGPCEVFVVTIQAMVASPATIDSISSMMEIGRWFVVVDEHHHYSASDDATWGHRVKSLPSRALLAMSATPHRRNGDGAFKAPDVVVSYLKAKQEKAVKPLILHAYHYAIDAITADGSVVSISTSELAEMAGGTAPEDIDRMMASRQMQWSPKYIYPLILNPAMRLVDLASDGLRAQMLVQALSCSHAEMVCRQIRDMNLGMTVDWVGTGPNGRSDDENRRVLDSFCPPKNKDGVRDWKLQVLVNVGMAGEGLDSTDVSEVVFLNSPNVNNTTLQIIGRGARRMRQEGSGSLSCTVNVDSSSELAAFVGADIMTVFDGDTLTSEEKEEIEREASEREYKPLADEPRVAIADVKLTSIEKERQLAVIAEKLESRGFTKGTPEFERLKEDLRLEIFEPNIEQHNASSRIAQIRNENDLAVKKIVGLLVKSQTIERSRIGDLMRKLNGAALKIVGAPIKACDEQQLRDRYRWLKQQEAILLSGGALPWLH